MLKKIALSLALLISVSAHADPSICSAAAATSPDGKPGVGGICTYDNPQVLFDGAMVPIQEESGSGFCYLQGKNFATSSAKENSAPQAPVVVMLTPDGQVSDTAIFNNILTSVTCK